MFSNTALREHSTLIKIMNVAIRMYARGFSADEAKMRFLRSGLSCRLGNITTRYNSPSVGHQFTFSRKYFPI